MIGNIKSLLMIPVFVFLLLGCAREKKAESITQMDIKQKEKFLIKLAKDTIGLKEFAKLSATLTSPYFSDTTSGIMVVLDNGKGAHLKSDLSNEFEIDMAIFLNLNFDTINQKWLGNVDYNKTVAFGKKFNTIGKDTIRGYILEYKGNTPPLGNSMDDTIEVKKYFFEKEIFIRKTDNSN